MTKQNNKKVTKEIVEKILNPEPVNIAGILRDEDRRALFSHPNEGKINPEWGASQVWGTVRIGPIREDAHSGYTPNYLERTVMTAESFKELNKLAEASGLEIIGSGEYDMDGIVQRNYRFKIKK